MVDNSREQQLIHQHVANIAYRAQNESKLKGIFYYFLFISPIGSWLFPKQHDIAWQLTKLHFSN